MSHLDKIYHTCRPFFVAELVPERQYKYPYMKYDFISDLISDSTLYLISVFFFHENESKMDRASFKNLGDWSLTLAGLAGLQLPCLVSAASPSSPLAKLKSLGFPFNMSAAILNEHFSFSPENLLQGRYHTLITNLFNHNGKVYFCINQNDDLLDGVLHLT